MERHEYIVTLHNYDDLESFYDDIETSGGTKYIPARQVECVLKRPISRNTHYLLTEKEVEKILKDSRVLAVERLPKDRGIEPGFFWEQTGNFEKSSSVDQNDKNWGLKRCIDGVPTSAWGTNGGGFTQVSNATIRTTGSGKNVDIVVVDAHVNPNHPEFAVNPDGSGGGRVITHDWTQYWDATYDDDFSNVVFSGGYNYSVVSSSHGTHVAGTIAGNTQGWARDANIYTIEFNYSNTPVAQWDLILYDIIRKFHRSKPINPATGRRNPTICNNSWGYSYNQISLSNVSSVTFRGTTTLLSGLNDSQKKATLEINGVPVPAGTYLFKTPARVAATDADIADCIADGVIFVASAGNSYWQITRINTDPDYNNNVVFGANTIEHTRGSTPGAAPGVICVGSLGAEHIEKKSNFSNWGARVDIWAPGSNIISALYNISGASEFGIPILYDPRNPNFLLGSISGTSMSSPQVTGVLACLMEHEPDLTQAQALSYLTNVSSGLGQIQNSEGSTGWIAPTLSPYDSIRSSDNNNFLKYVPLRPLSGLATPRDNHKRRPATGSVYPRTRRRR